VAILILVIHPHLHTTITAAGLLLAETIMMIEKDTTVGIAMIAAAMTDTRPMNAAAMAALLMKDLPMTHTNDVHTGKLGWYVNWLSQF